METTGNDPMRSCRRERTSALVVSSSSDEGQEEGREQAKSEKKRHGEDDGKDEAQERGQVVSAGGLKSLGSLRALEGFTSALNGPLIIDSKHFVHFVVLDMQCQFATECFLLEKPRTSNHDKHFVDFVVLNMQCQFATECCENKLVSLVASGSSQHGLQRSERL